VQGVAGGIRPAQVDPELVPAVLPLYRTTCVLGSDLPGLPHGQTAVEIENQDLQGGLDDRPHVDRPFNSLAGRVHRDVQVVVKYIVGRLLGRERPARILRRGRRAPPKPGKEQEQHEDSDGTATDH